MSFSKQFLLAVERLDAEAIEALALAHPAKAAAGVEGLEKEAWGALSGFSVAQDAQEHGLRWTSALDALRKLGFKPSKALIDSAIHGLLAEGASLGQLRWMLASGWLSGVDLNPNSPGSPCFRYGVHALAALLAKDGPEELAALELLVGAGLAGGSDRAITATDCVVLGAWRCAQALLDQGFDFGPCRSGGQAMALMRWEPVPALIATFVARRGGFERWGPKAHGAEEEAQGMVGELDRLLAMGARIDPTDQERFQANPLYPLLGGGSGRRQVPSMAMIHALGPKLLALGASPNTSWVTTRCLDLFHESREAQSPVDPQAIWDWALRAGAKPAADPARMFLRCSMAAIEANGLSMARELSQGDVDAGAIAKDAPASPVKEALRRGFYKLMWELVELGAPLDYVDSHGETLLHELAGEKSKIDLLASALQRPEIQALVEAGSTSKGRLGERAIHRACGAQSVRAIELLLDAGADVNARDGKGWTPMRHLLRKYGERAQKRVDPMLRLLLARGADPSIADLKGRTPAQAACSQGPLPALERLLSLRPQDIAGDEQAALAAKTALAKRGGAAASLATRLELDASCGSANQEPPKQRPKARL